MSKREDLLEALGEIRDKWVRQYGDTDESASAAAEEVFYKRAQPILNALAKLREGVAASIKSMVISSRTGPEQPRRERSSMSITLKRTFREADVARDADGQFADIPGVGNDAPAAGSRSNFASREDDARRSQGQTRSNFVHPVTGHALGKTETGDTYEALFEAKGAPLLEARYPGTYEAIAVTGGWLSRNTPLDFKVGNRGGELKSLSSKSLNQKTAIKKEEIERKQKAVAEAGLEPLLVVQVIDQETGTVQVYAFEAFASKAVAKMEHVGSYNYALDDFEAAQKKTGHHHKREARATKEWNPREHPRDTTGRFAETGSGALSGMLGRLAETGGFSWSPHSGEAPADGYMVAMTGHTMQLPEEILDDPEAAARAIVGYIKGKKSVFTGNQELYVGGWVEDGKLWLEPSERVPDRAAAIRKGREQDQIAIYDVAAGDVIDTGGAGGFLGTE